MQIEINYSYVNNSLIHSYWFVIDYCLYTLLYIVDKHNLWWLSLYPHSLFYSYTYILVDKDNIYLFCWRFLFLWLRSACLSFVLLVNSALQVNVFNYVYFLHLTLSIQYVFICNFSSIICVFSCFLLWHTLSLLRI